MKKCSFCSINVQKERIFNGFYYLCIIILDKKT